MDVDLACTSAFGALLLALTAGYGVRVVRSGRAHSARVDREGKSALLGKSVMEMLAWCVEPVVTACVKLRVTPDGVTYASLVLGVFAGGALATGHFGVGALLALVASACDAIDGLLARRLGVAGPAGEVLDATVDRYVDFALIGGLVFYFRARPADLLLALGALLAAFMVSYSTAKAEALHVSPPRGSMRRVERSVLLVGAAAIAPATGFFAPSWQEVPIFAALGLIAVAGNASAVQRLHAVRCVVRDRERSRVSGAAQRAAE